MSETFKETLKREANSKPKSVFGVFGKSAAGFIHSTLPLTDKEQQALIGEPPRTQRGLLIDNDEERAGMGDQLRSRERRKKQSRDIMSPENLRLDKLKRERWFKMDRYRRRNSTDPFTRDFQKTLDE